MTGEALWSNTFEPSDHHSSSAWDNASSSPEVNGLGAPNAHANGLMDGFLIAGTGMKSAPRVDTSVSENVAWSAAMDGIGNTHAPSGIDAGIAAAWGEALVPDQPVSDSWSQAATDQQHKNSPGTSIW